MARRTKGVRTVKRKTKRRVRQMTKPLTTVMNMSKEVDYMSDESSDSASEAEADADIKGVDQDEGLAKMLDSESSSSDEDKEDKDDDDDEDETGKKKKKKSGSRANSDDESPSGKKKKGNSANSSRSGTPTKDLDKAEKRKALVANILDPNASNEPAGKKSRLEQFGSAGSGGSSSGPVNEAISEEAVRRYLKRRPMTTTDLLKKFRSKKVGIQNAQLVQLLANYLKKINPHKQKVKGVTYLSLKD